MKFTKKNLDTWDRAELFQHFINDMRCVMSMTVNIDITEFLQVIHDKKYKFYPAMIWVISSAVNCREELRMGYNEDGEVGTWDYISPYYTHFHQEDEKFVKLVIDYHSDFEAFYQQFIKDMQVYQTYRWFDQKNIPPNTFDVSCLPWLHYQSFDMHIFDSGLYIAPVITWGKYIKNESGRLIMPLSLNIHHAVADGYHLCRFFTDVENCLKKFSNLIQSVNHFD